MERDDTRQLQDDGLEDVSDEEEGSQEAQFSSEEEEEDDDGEEEDEDDDEGEEGEEGSEEEGSEEGEDDEDWETDEDEEDNVLEASDTDSEEVEKCPICLNRFRDQDVGTPEACDHIFCLECIQEWAKMSDADWSDAESTYYTDTSLLDAAANTEPENTTKQTNSEAQTLKNTGQTTASQDRYNKNSEKDYDTDDSTLDATFKPNKKDINSSDSENQTLSNQSERESESDEDSIPLSELINQRTNGPVNAHLRSASYTNKHI